MHGHVLVVLDPSGLVLVDLLPEDVQMPSDAWIEFQTFPLTQRFQRIQGVELRRDLLRVVELEQLVLERGIVTPTELPTLRNADLIPPIDELLELVKVDRTIAGRIQRSQQILDLLL